MAAADEPADPTPSQSAAPAPPEPDVYDIGMPDILEEDSDTPSSGGPGAPGRADPAPAPATVVKAAHPHHLVEMARSYGLTDEDLSGMDGAAVLAAVAGARRWEAEERRQAQDRPQPGTPAPSEPALDWGVDASGEPLTEDAYAPAIRSFVKKSHEHEGRIAQLEQMVQSLLGAEGRRHSESQYDRVDRVFASLTDLAGVLGSGTRDQLDQSGAEFQRRQAVIDAARRKAGGEKATWDSLIKAIPQAARTLYGTPAAPAPQETPEAPEAQQIEDWNRGAVARPTHRKGAPEPRGRRAAERAVREAIRAQVQGANGHTVEDDGGEYGGL